jgi:ABC-2 type transport system ATP-binding protein
VVAAGVGARRGRRWALRSVSLRLERRPSGVNVVGIAARQPAASAAFIGLLTGEIRPAHGELRVLGEDLTTAAGRAAVRPLVGVARTSGAAVPGLRVRGLVLRAARLAGLPGPDRKQHAAAILERLSLAPWADLPVRSAPRIIRRRASLAAAAVHRPGLLLLDGLLDGLDPRELASLADGVRNLAWDTAVIVIGRDVSALGHACDQVLTLSHGILTTALTPRLLACRGNRRGGGEPLGCRTWTGACSRAGLAAMSPMLRTTPRSATA